MRRACSILAAFALILGASRVLHAAPQDPAAAQALFKDGRAAASKGDYAAACALFRESERADHALGTRFNLADCEQQLGHLATAWSLFEDLARELPPDDDRLPIAKERAAMLELRAPKLILRLAPGVKDASVTRDGVAVAGPSFGIPLPIDPGSHSVRVTSAGHEPGAFSVDAKEGTTAELVVAPGPALAPRAPEAAPPASGSTRRTLGFVLGGVGVVGLGVGFIGGLLVLGDMRSVSRYCDASELCTDQAGIDAAKNGRVASTVSTAGFVAGVALLGAGIGLVVTSSDGSSRDPPRGGPLPDARRLAGAGWSTMVIAPTLAPSAAGLRLSRSF